MCAQAELTRLKAAVSELQAAEKVLISSWDAEVCRSPYRTARNPGGVTLCNTAALIHPAGIGSHRLQVQERRQAQRAKRALEAKLQLAQTQVTVRQHTVLGPGGAGILNSIALIHPAGRDGA